jgi:hypothetical protein
MGIIIQSCGINWGKQQTHNKLQNSKQIKENRLRFSKHIQNSLLHGTSSSKVVGLIKGNNIYSQPITQLKPNTENKIRFANQAQSRGPEFTLSKANAASNKVGSSCNQ